MRPRRLSFSTIFAAIFLAYAGMQLYVVSRAQAGLGLGPATVAALLTWVALMTAAPLLLWRFERAGWHRAATTAAWFGYGWMGFAFLFFWIALGIDILGWALQTAGASSDHGLGEYLAVPRDSFLVALACTLAASAYGAVAARRPRVECVRLTTPKLPAHAAPLRIAQISDIHLGILVGKRRVRRIVDYLQTLDADVLVSTGDLVDGQADRLRGLAPLFAQLRPRLGKFAITGNHEYFQGIRHAIDFHTRAGFTMLQGTAVEVGEHFALAGVDDLTGPRFDPNARTDERAALAGVSSRRFTVLLKHQPLPDTQAPFDLQLSGHTHKGQIFPFSLVVRLRYPWIAGLTRLARYRWLYVNRGTGTWGPPLRILAPAEITLIEVAPVKAH